MQGRPAATRGCQRISAFLNFHFVITPEYTIFAASSPTPTPLRAGLRDNVAGIPPADASPHKRRARLPGAEIGGVGAVAVSELSV